MQTQRFVGNLTLDQIKGMMQSTSLPIHGSVTISPTLTPQMTAGSQRYDMIYGVIVPDEERLP